MTPDGERAMLHAAMHVVNANERPSLRAPLLMEMEMEMDPPHARLRDLYEQYVDL